MKLVPPGSQHGTISFRFAFTLLAAALIPLLAYAAAPSWWAARGVLRDSTPADDFAPVNQGQVKNIAKAAVAEMDAKLSGGAGDILHSLVNSWSTPNSQTNDFASVNLGQLKNIAKPFYDRMISAGLTDNYPWVAESNPSDDFAVANIGQVKNLFSFEFPAVDPLYDGDNNGLPDAWERQYFGTIGVDPNADSDGDSVSNLQEYLNGTDPTDFYNGTLPTLSVVGGDQRGNPGTLLPIPVSVIVYRYGARNAPLTFTVTQGQALLAPDDTGTIPPAATLDARANTIDPDGYGFYTAQVYVSLPSTPGVSVIRAMVNSGGRTASVTTTAVAIDPSLAPPTNLVVTPTSPSSAQLTWSGGNDAVATTVQASVDGGRTWITLGAVGPGVTKTTVRGLTPDRVVSFRLFSGGTPSVTGEGVLVMPSDGITPPASPPPPGSGGGGATPPADAKPLGEPVIEGELKGFGLYKTGWIGYLVSTNHYLTATGTLTSTKGKDVDYGGDGRWVKISRWDPITNALTSEITEDTGFVHGYSGGTTTIESDTTKVYRSVDPAGGGGTFSSTNIYSDLYTNEALRVNVESRIPPFEGNFREREDSAYFYLDDEGYNVYQLRYRWKVNADPKLVVTWDVQFTPYDGGSVRHEVHQWNANGQTQSPTYLLDPRGGGNGQYEVLLLAAEPMVDGNRDGQMSFTDTGVRDADQTSSEKPYRFWLNDDDDTQLGPAEAGEVAKETETVPALRPDFQQHRIVSKRNLEDFSRLWLKVPDDLSYYLEQGDIQVGLKWKTVQSGAPAINVYPSADGEGSTNYLTSENAAQEQIGNVFNEAVRDRNNRQSVETNSLFIFKKDYWTDSRSRTKKCFLFEGASEGKGELSVVFLDENGNQFAEGGSVWLELKNIKKMYQRGKAQPENIAAPNGNVVGPLTGPMSYVDDPISEQLKFEADPNEERKAVLFAHGWSVDYNDYTNYAETMFKRLWHQGFKGRFCSLRWDPLVVSEIFDISTSAGEYNRSEHRAWLYGESLRQFGNAIKNQGFTVSLIGHSMGNIVCSSSLQKGLSVQNYLLMEAAVPAGCFDTSGGNGAGGVNGYGRFWNAEVNEPTPDHDQNPSGELTKGYRGFLANVGNNVVGAVVNFHNSDDYALATGYKLFGSVEANWEKNETAYKPDGNTGTDWQYRYDPAHPDLNKRATQEFTFFVGRFVTDSYEMKSFVARPRSKAAGAVDASLGDLPAALLART